MKQSKATISVNPMRSTCPIANTLDIIGDKWTLLIIRDAFAGKKNLQRISGVPENIPTNILANRLKRLHAFDILKKEPYQQHPVRFAYRLTAKGRALRPILDTVLDWGLTHIQHTKAKINMEH